MQKITPFLWYNGNAEEAAKLYTSVFKNSEILETRRFPEDGPMPAGSVISVTFKIEGIEYVAFNGGPAFNFTPGVSLFVNCNTQEEVDELWEKLSEGGEKERCGWLKDRFGLSWQIIPVKLGQLLQDKDPAKAQRVMGAMMAMSKIDIAALEAAYNAA